MKQGDVIEKTKNYVRKKFSGESTGHDWWHIYRVWKMARKIGKKEKADMFIVELGALLHDIADFKFYSGDDTVGPRKASEWLRSLEVDDEEIKKVSHIIDNVSFKGAKVKSKMESLEGKIVQDADRLDAIGAIGISRTFAFGGSKHRPLYEPNVKPIIHKTFEEYKKGSASTINHFYEKLLHVKDLMNTDTGKEIAQERHRFVEGYLKRFLEEWEGKK